MRIIAYFYILYSNEAHSSGFTCSALSPYSLRIEEAAVHLGASHLRQKFSQPLERGEIPTRNEHLSRYMLLRSLFAIAHFAGITRINAMLADDLTLRNESII
jgi:hypothetical protein